MTLDPATLSALAATAVTALVPLLQQAATKGFEKLGESTAGTLFEKLKNRLTKASAQEALEDLAKEPQDSTNQDLVKGQITKALKEQPELVAELQAWLKEAGAESAGVSQAMDISGSHNKAAQVHGSGNAVHIG